MTPLAERVVHSYLSHLSVEIISRIEKIPAAEVERIVARAVGVPSEKLRLAR